MYNMLSAMHALPIWPTLYGTLSLISRDQEERGAVGPRAAHVRHRVEHRHVGSADGGVGDTVEKRHLRQVPYYASVGAGAPLVRGRRYG